jgi:phosphoribosylanthranilate isomerase
MRARVKICCIASPNEARLAIASGAYAVGLVAKMPSGPGTISDKMIGQIASIVPASIESFLLTSETSASAISEHIRMTRPTTVQIVAHIDPAQSELLARREPAVRFVQVIHVEDKAALELIPVYSPFVHAFLLDSGRPSAKIAELGGTGRTHDWSISTQFVKHSPRPVFLAGGLNAANVGTAIEQVRPFGVDVCTGVRTDGQLDGGKLAAFMRAVDAVQAQ